MRVIGSRNTKNVGADYITKARTSGCPGPNKITFDAALLPKEYRFREIELAEMSDQEVAELAAMLRKFTAPDRRQLAILTRKLAQA